VPRQSTPTPGPRQKRALQGYERAYRKLRAELAAVGFICPGTVVSQRLRCGKPTCACQTDPDRRHGPYAYWTTKVKGRTVSRKLTPDQAKLYTQWIRNRRQLDRTLRKMRTVSEKVAAVLLGKAVTARLS